MRKGTRVSWNWGAGRGEGKILERYTERVQRRLKGSTVTRNATADEPAFLVQTDDGDQVLKSATELTVVTDP